MKNTEYYLEEKGVIKELNITKHTFDWLITNEILKSVQSKCNTMYYSILDIQKIKKAIELYKEKEMDKC